MARVRRQIIVCSVLGLMTTIAVAWVAAARAWTWTSVRTLPWERRAATTISPGSRPIWVFGEVRLPAVRKCIAWTLEADQRGHIDATLWLGSVPPVSVPVSQTGKELPPGWSFGGRNSRWREPEDGFSYHEDLAAGWPLPALRWTRSVSISAAGTQVNESGAMNRPLWSKRYTKSQKLPYAPVLQGLVADSAVFGAGWFILLFGFGYLRRSRRALAGHCIKCSYDLRGTLDRGCPECGWQRDPK